MNAPVKTKSVWEPANRYEGIVPFAATNYPGGPDWQIAEPDGDATPGKVVLQIVEVIGTKSAGRVVIYYRHFIDPDGRTVNRRRRRIGSLASLRGYITRRALKVVSS
jgi:hypothetical protein